MPRLWFIFSILLCIISTSALAFQPGEKAPDFTLKNLNGENVSLSDFKGRPLILDLGATWCPGCRQQGRETAKVAAHYPDAQVGVLEVFIQDSEKAVRSFVKGRSGHPESSLIDDDTILNRYLVYLIPRVLVIDQNGIIQYDGSLTKAQKVIEVVDRLLEEKASQSGAS